MNIRSSFLFLLAGALVAMPLSGTFAQEEGDDKEEDVQALGTYTVGGNRTKFNFESDDSKEPAVSRPDISFERAKPKFKISLPPPGSNRSDRNRSSDTGRKAPEATANPPKPSGPIRQPVPVSLPAPEYPRDAARQHIEGYVVIEFTVTPGGATSDIEIIRGQPRRTFDREARQAVSKWRYKPATQGGQPIPMRVQQTIKFDL